MTTDPNIPVRMRLPALAAPPAPTLPPGFSIARYAPGDAPRWVEVYSAAESYHPISLEVFAREFHGDEAALGERMLFLRAPDGRFVAIELNSFSAAVWWTKQFDDFRERHAEAVRRLVSAIPAR